MDGAVLTGAANKLCVLIKTETGIPGGVPG